MVDSRWAIDMVVRPMRTCHDKEQHSILWFVLLWRFLALQNNHLSREMISEFQVEANWTAAALLEHNYKDLAKLMFLALCVVDLVFHFSGG